MSLIAKKLQRIKPSPTLAISNKAAELKKSGIDVISLGAGEPDFDTPENIKLAAIKAIQAGHTKYTAVGGTDELKKAICQKFSRENKIVYTPEQIIVSCGAKHVIFNAFLATLDANDEVIIPAPYWVSYPDMVTIAGGQPVFVECKPSNNFMLDIKQLKASITGKTKWLILNSPSNPTGSVYSKENLRKVADLLLDYPQINILSDDIYEHIVDDQTQFHTIAAIEPLLHNRVLTVNGVSKSYSMTGWRIGYAAGSPELIKAMHVLQSQSTSNPCSISQAAALEALTGTQSFIPLNAKLFQQRRDLLVGLLNEIKYIKCSKPNGAFYVFPDCSKMYGKKTPKGKVIQNSDDVAEYFLDQALVAVVQGTAFGMDGFFRISYATSEEVLIEACARIKEACNLLV